MTKPTLWWTWQRLVGNYSCFSIHPFKMEEMQMQVLLTSVCVCCVFFFFKEMKVWICFGFGLLNETSSLCL